uniref:Fringe-like glycosyltransferase domain-containing protein n=1 Tax=Panagrolaimus superbus TaxID=310955 RepID=A0A914YD20_9BILA
MLKKYKTFGYTVIICVIIYFCWNKVKTKLEGNYLTITVKTAFRTHNTRVAQIVDSWFQLAPKNIYFITDAFDPVLQRKGQRNTYKYKLWLRI